MRIDVAGGEAVRALSLETQIRIAVARRAYDDATRARLVPVLGTPDRATTAPGLFWARATIAVPGFQGSTTVDLPVACTYDLDVAATCYFEALADGDVPLDFLFSGSVFYAGDDGALRVERIAWDREASFRMPVATWRAMMERHFPNTGWLRLERDTIRRLYAYKTRRALATFDAALAELLPQPDENTDETIDGEARA